MVRHRFLLVPNLERTVHDSLQLFVRVEFFADDQSQVLADDFLVTDFAALILRKLQDEISLDWLVRLNISSRRLLSEFVY